MLDHYRLIQDLTSEIWSAGEYRRRLNDFAVELGWRPSDQLPLPNAEDFASGHLVVEHGLQNTAIISFLRRPVRYPELNPFQQKVLLNASYNNLIDWHIAVDYDGVSFVYNRATPPSFFSYRRQLSREQTSQLSSDTFDTLSTDHPSPSVPALDTALIQTISRWKRQLATDIRTVSNEELSALFNAVILIRALEDYHAKHGRLQFVPLRDLLNAPNMNASRLLSEAVESFTNSHLPAELFDVNKLEKFDTLDGVTLGEFILDFYRNRYQPYFDYDFAIMSKHALSRVYEHYVSLLRFDDSSQTSLFPRLPTEKLERSFGNVYTPEFIARFFAKYIRNELPLSKFRNLTICDPACGSGIFLRATLEAKFETLLESLTTQTVIDSFDFVSGVDIDGNACAAARLSLSLLSLVHTGVVPNTLHITQGDTLDLMRSHVELRESTDVVITNPPFVGIDDLPTERRRSLLSVLGTAARGKTDLYLGLLKAGLDMLKPGGFGLYVLPKNFLISENAGPMRSELSHNALLHCVVDLSAVRVFEDVGAYVVLLIFQKGQADRGRPVLVARCNDLVGSALDATLQQHEVRTPAYDIFWSNQPNPEDTEWKFATPERAAFESKLYKLPRLGDVAEVRQGIITGADDIFIVPANAVPKQEKDIYAPFLRDRDIEPYRVPERAKQFVVYPFSGDEQLDEKSLQKRYPRTWAYLIDHKNQLISRKSVKHKGNPWWRPIRPRQPSKLLCRKIVTPHLVLSPRFAVDLQGRFIVSHSPYITIPEPASADELLYLLGVLNSTPCFWLITERAHNYSRGYSRLEVTTLRRTPIPNPATVERSLVREIIRLVKIRTESSGPEAIELERTLDQRVADAYGLSNTERRIVGMGAFQ